jgi:hypothetical protein
MPVLAVWMPGLSAEVGIGQVLGGAIARIHCLMWSAHLRHVVAPRCGTFAPRCCTLRHFVVQLCGPLRHFGQLGTLMHFASRCTTLQHFAALWTALRQLWTALRHLLAGSQQTSQGYLL